MSCLKKQINAIEYSLTQQVKLREEFQELNSIDGIGVILALTIMLGTGCVNRFAKVGNYASYYRCVCGRAIAMVKRRVQQTQRTGINT